MSGQRHGSGLYLRDSRHSSTSETVITGLGCILPGANGCEELRQGLHSGACYITPLNDPRIRCVDQLWFGRIDPVLDQTAQAYVPHRLARYASVQTGWGMAAVAQAMELAGLKFGGDSHGDHLEGSGRMGIYAAQGEHFMQDLPAFDRALARTGRFIASSHSGVRADTYTLSKALGGGLAKIAVTMVQSTQFDQNFGLVHSSTFAEDGFSTAVAQAVLDQIEADDGAFYAMVRDRGQRLKDGLEELRRNSSTVIADVRGRGMMLAVEFHDQAQAPSRIFRSAAHTNAFGYFVAGYLLREHTIRVAPTGSSSNTIRIQPPALINDSQISQILAGFEQLCRIISCQDTYHLVHAMVADGPGTGTKARIQVRDFRDQGCGQQPVTLINIARVLGRGGQVRNTAYCASKHGLLGLAKALALDLAPRGITVNAILPGWVETPMLLGELTHQAQAMGVEPEQVFRKARRRVPIRRFVTSDDVAAMVGFLASASAAAITAQCFTVDGGFTVGY